MTSPNLALTDDLVLLRGMGGCPSDAPLIACAEAGISCLSVATSSWDPDVRSPLLRLAHAMRVANDGPLVAVYSHPGAPRAVGLVQSNRGNFYANAHAPDEPWIRAWRDYYHDTAWGLLDLLDRTLEPPAVELMHPAGHGWPRDVAPAFLEGMCHYADGGRGSIRSVYVDIDCSPDGWDKMHAALPALEQERQNGTSSLRPIAQESVDAASIGAREATPYARIIRLGTRRSDRRG